MKISTSTGTLFSTFGEREGIKVLAEAGFDCLDFSFFDRFDTTRDDSPLNQPAYLETAKALRAYAQSLGVTFNQAHAPFPTSVGEPERDARIFEGVVRSMEIASILGVKQIIVHPKIHLSHAAHAQELYEINRDFYRALTPYCEKYNIRIAVENMWERDPKRRYIVHCACAAPAEMNAYLDELDPKWFVSCIDVGHCALVGEDAGDMIRAIGPRLHALHIHDVDYIHDNHNLPGTQQLDFDGIARALAQVRYDGEFTLEADGFYGRFETDFYPQVAKFMATRARYIADKADAYREK